MTRDGTGFTVEYDGGSCWKGSEVKWSTKILVLCGKLLVSDVRVELVCRLFLAKQTLII